MLFCTLFLQPASMRSRVQHPVRQYAKQCVVMTSSARSTWTTGDQRPRPPHTPAGQRGGSRPDPLQGVVLLSTEAAGAGSLLTGRARISTPGTCSRPGEGEQCWGSTHGRPRPLPAALPPPQPPPAAVAAAPHQRASRPRVRAGDPAPAPARWSQGFAQCHPPNTPQRALVTRR